MITNALKCICSVSCTLLIKTSLRPISGVPWKDFQSKYVSSEEKDSIRSEHVVTALYNCAFRTHFVPRITCKHM